MKRYIFLMTIATIFCQISPVFSGFFIPQKELEQRYEKLPPIPNGGAYSNQPASIPEASATHYIAVDGRFIPVIENTSPVETNLAQSHQIQNQDMVEEQILAENPAPVETQVAAPVEPVVKEEVFFAAMAPQIEPVDVSAPSYKKRYAQYLESLQSFQLTGVMPNNPELEQTLSKLNSNEYVVYYKQKRQ